MSVFYQTGGKCNEWITFKLEKCNHPQHDPPMHLYIPPFVQYTHICPGCGRTITIGSNGITY